MTGCPGNYQYENQPPTSFTHCNPVNTILQLGCIVLVPSDSTTIIIDWYWSKNISECGKYITEEQGRFTITTNRGHSHLLNVDRITTNLNIESPQTDTGYYWCQVNDPSYNGVFIASNKAPVFDTGTMTTCSGTQSTLQPICAVGSVPPLICSEIVAVSTSQTSSKITYSPDLIYHMTRALVTPVGVTSNTPVPSGVISDTSIPSGVINSVVISPTVTPQKTSRNIIVISTIVAVFVLLILLILLITTIIIIIVITKKKTNSGK